ncbi:MAG: M55 family metallopeptidase, partial [Candidatus Dormiibacterota bacterium]
QHTAAQAEPILVGAERVVVKQSLTRLAARSLHPTVARRRIHDGAISSLARLQEIPAPVLPSPVLLRVLLRNADLVKLAALIQGVRALSELEVAIEGDDCLEVYRRFVGLLQITRGVAQER